MLRSHACRDHGLRHYNIHATFHMLPGLQLDELILDVTDAIREFKCGEEYRPEFGHVSALIECGTGWKRLVVICRYRIARWWSHKKAGDNRTTRIAQPKCWDDRLKARDGEESGAMVRMYKPCSVSRGAKALEDLRFDRRPPEGYKRFNQEIQTMPTKYAQFNIGLPDGMDDAYTIIVAERGRGVDYVQQATHTGHKGRHMGSIRKLIGKRTWEQAEEYKVR